MVAKEGGIRQREGGGGIEEQIIVVVVVNVNSDIGRVEGNGVNDGR